MSTVIVDDALRQQLLSATGEIEFRDAAGNLLARGTRHWTIEELKAMYPPGTWLSDEELDRRSKMDGYTTDEVIAHLRGLSK